MLCKKQKIKCSCSVSLAVICALHPWRGHLLQHLLLPEAALLPGPGTQRWRGCAAGSRCQNCGWCLYAAIHSYQNTLWGEQLPLIVLCLSVKLHERFCVFSHLSLTWFLSHYLLCFGFCVNSPWLRFRQWLVICINRNPELFKAVVHLLTFGRSISNSSVLIQVSSKWPVIWEQGVCVCFCVVSPLSSL